MRDTRFIAEHRGGPLKKKQHRQLSQWASGCSEHVMPLLGDNIDFRLVQALVVADEWRSGLASVGRSRDASVGAHNVARESLAPTVIAVARSVGHAVATAHMADHAMGAAWYALKAIKNEKKSVEMERQWQREQLPDEIKELVVSAWEKRGFKV